MYVHVSTEDTSEAKTKNQQKGVSFLTAPVMTFVEITMELIIPLCLPYVHIT